MNVLVRWILTYLCLTHSLLIALHFCFLPHFVLCLIAWYYIMQYNFTFFCLHLVLMKSIWLAFILLRDVFVLTRIKTPVVFPDPPLLTPDEGLEMSIFPLLFQVVREPLPFSYHWIHYLHLSGNVSLIYYHTCLSGRRGNGDWLKNMFDTPLVSYGVFSE